MGTGVAQPPGKPAEHEGPRPYRQDPPPRQPPTLRAAMNMGVSDLHVGSLPVPGVCGQAGEPAVAPADGFRVLGSCGQGLRRVQAGQGAARSRANAAARWVAQGQSRSSLSCQRRPVRTSRPAMLVRR